MSSSSGIKKTTSLSHLLIVLQSAVLNHVCPSRCVVPWNLLDLEEVLPGHGGDARCSAAQQQHPPQSHPLHFRGRSDQEPWDPALCHSWDCCQPTEPEWVLYPRKNLEANAQQQQGGQWPRNGVEARVVFDLFCENCTKTDNGSAGNICFWFCEWRKSGFFAFRLHKKAKTNKQKKN